MHGSEQMQRPPNLSIPHPRQLYSVVMRTSSTRVIVGHVTLMNRRILFDVLQKDAIIGTLQGIRI